MTESDREDMDDYVSTLEESEEEEKKTLVVSSIPLYHPDEGSRRKFKLPHLKDPNLCPFEDSIALCCIFSTLLSS
jgi:hypothetical protein